ncbi:WYL domain-containing protein [Pontiellaceae bacterium B1224]|nr:WYL domain-containing protein [Pontiellaceae bacterium B1224]
MNRSKTQMRRLMELDALMQQRKYPNCSSFGKKWEVSSKTIQRDIEFMKYQLNAPIEYDALKRGFYYTEPSYMMSSVPMNEGELMALVIGARALEQYKGTPIAAKLESVLQKLSEILPDEITIHPAELFSRFSFSSPPAMPIRPKIWETVVKGLLSKRQLEITYQGKTSRVSPLHMANLQGAWYLFVRFYDYDNFRQIAIGRIETAKLLKEAVDDTGFDPNVFLSNTLYRFAGDNEPFTVKLVFDKAIADQVMELEWHPGQKTKTLKDGRVEMEFTAKGDVEVKRWIMAWGQYCTVKSPKWVKQMIDDEVDAMMLNRKK